MCKVEFISAIIKLCGHKITDNTERKEINLSVNKSRKTYLDLNCDILTKR